MDTGRLGKAVLIALSIQLLLTGISGAVSPTDTRYFQTPDRFETPEVRPGDSGLYQVEGVDGSGPPTVEGHELQTVLVQWENATRSLAGDGSYPWTAGLTLFLDFVEQDNQPVPGQPETSTGQVSYDVSIAVDYDTRNWTSTGTTVEIHSSEGAQLTGTLSLDARTLERTSWTEDLRQPPTPCGFHLPFHGHPANLSAPLEPVGDCGGTNGTLTATGVEQRNETRALKLETSHAGPVEAWYSPRLSLPIEWAGPLEALAFPLEDKATLQLVEYERGPDPLQVTPEDDHAGHWAIATDDWNPWGPTERNLVNVSFPLSEAYQTLLDESDEAQAFLEDHPTAYTGQAWMYKDRDALDRPRTTWQIVLTDGTEHFERFVSRSAPVEAPVGDVQVQPPAEVSSRGTAPVDAPDLPDRYPAPSIKPDRLPVVDGDVLVVGDDEAYAPWEAPASSFYAFKVACADEICSDSSTVVEVGAKPHLRDDPGPRSTPWAQNVSATMAGLSPDGGIEYLRGTHEVSSPSTFQESGAQSPHPPGSGFDGGEWDLPPAETTAGVSILALLAGIFYYVWPKIKLFVVGLYSRIGKDPDDVLENETRQRIFDLVREEPGIHFRELRRRLETGIGSLEHHLDKLLRADMITKEATEGYDCYFLAGSVQAEVREVAEHLRTDSAREIARAVVEHPGSSATEIAESLGLSRPAVSYHIDQLEEAGLLRKEREGRSIAIDLTDLGLKVVDALNLGSPGDS